MENKKEKQAYTSRSGGMYHGLNVPIGLLDAVIIGGITAITLIIIAAVRV